jgi:tetratricopeptide (TPR) repeat protein
LSIGFGFYSRCISRPRFYPDYYPVYTPPVIVESPTYVVPQVAPQEYYAPEPTYAPAPEPAYAPAYPPSYEPAYASAPTVPAEQLEGMISDGTRLFRDGQYAQAADVLLRAANADPRNADARLAYGIAQFALGDYSAAAAAVRQGIGISPEIVNTAFDLRDNYGKVEDFDAHFDRLGRRVANEPNDGDALLVLGFVYHFVGDREDAAAVFGQVKARGWADAGLADVFLNARAVAQNAAGAQP